MQRRQWHPTPVLLSGKPHGWKSLVGYSPWDREESDMTERLHFHFSLSCTGEGNGNPLQCSCLENPRDSGAWWAAICGVAQSWTRLKWLSSSSSMCTWEDISSINGFRLWYKSVRATWLIFLVYLTWLTSRYVLKFSIIRRLLFLLTYLAVSTSYLLMCHLVNRYF